MPHKKIKDIPALLLLVRKAKKEGKTIITTNGCFDILHVGHARNLAFAKSLGDILIVGVNSDASVRAIKGSTRPIVPARERAELLAALAVVDHIFIFGGSTPLPWLEKLKPHIHVKGKERRTSGLLEKDLVERNRGKVILAPYHRGRSTTGVIERVLANHGRGKRKTR